MKQAILSLILALLLLVGCKTTETVRYVDREVVVKRDSIVERTVIDTFFIYPPQDNQVITTDSSFLKTDLAFSFAKIQPDGKLLHSIENFGIIPGKVDKEKITVDDSTQVKESTIIRKTVTLTRYKKGFSGTRVCLAAFSLFFF